MSEKLASTGQAFLSYLEEWLAALPEKTLELAAPVPGEAAVISVDLVKGFCSVGPLASPRVNDIVPSSVALFKRAWARGIRHIVLAQDTHEPDALEFEAWPPHCVRGTQESETVEAIQALPFYAEMTVIPKNSIHSGLNTSLPAWMEDHPEITTFIVVGDCTDLCVYQMAMNLRLEANARHIQRRVIVPANCVATYDFPVEVARELNALPHPGDFLHATFLYHLALNGIEVVGKII